MVTTKGSITFYRATACQPERHILFSAIYQRQWKEKKKNKCPHNAINSELHFSRNNE